MYGSIGSDKIKQVYITGEERVHVLSGVYHQGIMYYDMGNVKFINHSGIADLIELIKTWTELGTEVRFLFVRDDIRKKLKEYNLDQIIQCE
jgi:anti-anti-sigma regulatory factor